MAIVGALFKIPLTNWWKNLRDGIHHLNLNDVKQLRFQPISNIDANINSPHMHSANRVTF